MAAQGGFGSDHQAENRRDNNNARSGQSRPHGEGGGDGSGFRREDKGGMMPGSGKRGADPGETVGSSYSADGAAQRGQATAGSSFSQKQQQQQTRAGESSRVGGSDRQRPVNQPQQSYQNSSELRGGDTSRTTSSPSRGRGGRGRGGGGGDGGGEGGGRDTSARSGTAPTPHVLPTDTSNSRDGISTSPGRVDGSRGRVSGRDWSPLRTRDGSFDKSGVNGSPGRALNQQADVGQGKHGQNGGKSGTEATVSSVFAAEGKRRGDDKGGGFRAQGNESARLTTPPHRDDARFSRNNNSDSTAATVMGRGVVHASDAPTDVSSAGESEQQQRRRDGNIRGREQADSANNGNFIGGGLGGVGGADRNRHSSPSRSGSPSPQGATTITATLKSVQDRPKIQHMPKTMSEVAIAAGGGAASSGEDGTSPERTAGVAHTDREPRKRALVEKEPREGDGKDGAAKSGKGMTDRQERALRAFLQGVRH